MYRKRLMMREANQSLRNRQESAAIHVPVSLTNVGPDNLAWFVEIASDHRRKIARRMKTYLIKFSDRDEGPYDETQMAQMFADRRIDRNTPCKPADREDWKTVDDYLPMLKYGTQLPPATKVAAVPPTPPPVLLSQRVSVVDFDIPFGSVLKIMFKWMAAGFVVFCCFLPVIFVLWLIVAAIFAALFNGVMSSLHHP
jgi:GYF domain 2